MSNAGAARWRVLILAFDGVEALDFAGPFEVFTTATRMHHRLHPDAAPLFEVAAVGDVTPPHPVATARAGLRLLPDHGLADSPQADVLIVPGGVVDQPMASLETLQWIARQAASASV